MADKLGNLRIHIAGDACHTHSPKAGQGMNVSMMDAYNLSWKLAHALLGLAADPNALLATYESERLDIARQLIEFDTKFSSMFSGKIGEEHGLTHEEFVHVFRTGGGFTSGCGIEYKEGLLVMRNTAHSNGQTAAQKRTSEVRSLPASHGKIPMLKKLKEILVGRKVANNHKIAQEGATPETGLLTPGRRLLNVKVSRFADANPRNIHDGELRLTVPNIQHSPIDPNKAPDLPSTSRYRVIALLPAAYTTDPVAYFPHLIYLTETLPALFPPSLIESIIIHPHEANHSLEWMTHFPKCVREKSEWLVFGDEFNEAYKNWGVDREKGAVAVVRPDGYVGVVTEAEELFGGGKELLREYLERLLKRVEA